MKRRKKGRKIFAKMSQNKRRRCNACIEVGGGRFEKICELTGKNAVISTTHNVKQQTFKGKKKGKIKKKTLKRKRRFPVAYFTSSSTEANFGMNETLPTTCPNLKLFPLYPSKRGPRWCSG